MNERQCPKCGRTLTVENGAAFCPFCGGALKPVDAPDRSPEVQALLKRAGAETDPVKRHKLLSEAQAIAPDDLTVNEELLFLGRLHERDHKSLDFSVIKSYLLQLYLTPNTFDQAKSAAMREELFSHPQLLRCLELAPDRRTYLAQYLTRLSEEFISLFLRGNSAYMHRYFGFGFESRAPKYLADPAGLMLRNMCDDTALTDEQRAVLTHAFYDAFSRQMNGETQWLNQLLEQLNVSLDQ